MHPWFRTPAWNYTSKHKTAWWLFIERRREERQPLRSQPFGNLLSLMAATRRSSLQQRLTADGLCPPISQGWLAVITAALNGSWDGLFIFLYFGPQYAKQGVIQRSLRGRSQYLSLLYYRCLTGYRKEVGKQRGEDREEQITALHQKKKKPLWRYVYNTSIWSEQSSECLSKGLTSDKFLFSPFFFSGKTFRPKDSYPLLTYLLPVIKSKAQAIQGDCVKFWFLMENFYI